LVNFQDLEELRQQNQQQKEHNFIEQTGLEVKEEWQVIQIKNFWYEIIHLMYFIYLSLMAIIIILDC